MFKKAFGGREKDFDRLANLEDSESLLTDSGLATTALRSSIRPSYQVSWFIIAFSVILTATLSIPFGAWLGRVWLHNVDGFSILQISQYSPIVSDVGVNYSPTRFNGSLLKQNVFREDAGPNVDAAWKSLGADFRAARIPPSQAARSGLAQDQVKINDKYGGGYPAHVEGLHHLHCLNLLRKSLAWNFDYYKRQGLGPFSNDADILKYHITHCLDILRQQLMCTVDVGVLGQVWYEPPGKPVQAFVDFNTRHKCRNFYDIRDWAEKHQLPDEPPEDFLAEPKSGDRIWHTVP